MFLHFLCPCWLQQKSSHSHPHLDFAVRQMFSAESPTMASYLLLGSLLPCLLPPDSKMTCPPHPQPTSQHLSSSLTSVFPHPTHLEQPLFFHCPCPWTAWGLLEKSPETHYLTVRLSSIFSESHPARRHPCSSSRFPTLQPDHICFLTQDTVFTPATPKTPPQLPAIC